MMRGVKILLPPLVALMFMTTFLVLPVVAFGQAEGGGIIDTSGCTGVEIEGEGGVECGFVHFINLVNGVMNFIIVLSLPATAIVMAYAGFQLITSGDNESKRSDAKSMLWKVVIGFLFILSAWLIVKAITAPLLKEGYVNI